MVATRHIAAVVGGLHASSDESFSPQIGLHLCHMQGTPPSSLSSDSALGNDGKDAGEAVSDDGERGKGRAAEAMHCLDLAHLSAKPVRELAEILRARRRELRSEHAELEEDRRQWRNEARQLRKTGRSGSRTAAPDAVTDARGSLDARATQLNKAINDHRALEQFLMSRQQQRGSPQSPIVTTAAEQASPPPEGQHRLGTSKGGLANLQGPPQSPLLGHSPRSSRGMATAQLASSSAPGFARTSRTASVSAAAAGASALAPRTSGRSTERARSCDCQLAGAPDPFRAPSGGA